MRDSRYHLVTSTTREISWEKLKTEAKSLKSTMANVTMNLRTGVKLKGLKKGTNHPEDLVKILVDPTGQDTFIRTICQCDPLESQINFVKEVTQEKKY